MVKSIRSLEAEGFFALPYPPELRASVNETVEAWVEFCNLPNEVKDGIGYSNAVAGVGYERKDGTGPRGDRKENFDVSLAGQEWLQAEDAARQDPAVTKFITRVIELAGGDQAIYP